MSAGAGSSGNLKQSQQQQQQQLPAGSGEDMDGLAAAYERLAVRFNQLEAAYNQLRPAAAAAAAAASASSSSAPLPACFRSTAADSSSAAATASAASASAAHDDESSLASAGAVADAAKTLLLTSTSPISPGASTVAKPQPHHTLHHPHQQQMQPLLSNKPVSLLLEEIERLRERAERAESLAAAWERQAGHTVEQLEMLSSQLEELHSAAMNAGEEGGRACRMLEAGLAGLRRLVSGQRALLDKLMLRETLRFQQQQQQQRRRRHAPDSSSWQSVDADLPDGSNDQHRQPHKQQLLRKVRRRKRHHQPHQPPQQLHRFADGDNEADIDDEIDNDVDNDENDDDDEVIEYAPDGSAVAAAATAASAPSGGSQYDNYQQQDAEGAVGGAGASGDNWSRFLLAPSSSLLPRTDSLDHLRDDDDDQGGYAIGGATGLSSFAGGMQGLEMRHYNSVDDMHAWLAAGDTSCGGNAGSGDIDILLDEDDRNVHHHQQQHLMMETDSASGFAERMHCPVCGLVMPPNGDLSAFNLHVNSHFADD